MTRQEEFHFLLHNHMLGYYNCCEQITIFLEEKKKHLTYNYFTIFVFDERLHPENSREYLNSKPIALTKALNLGCIRKVITLPEAEQVFGTLCQALPGGVVDIGDGALQVGHMEMPSRVFVPRDSTKTSSLNRILKNNFTNGSYIMEFFDVQKQIRGLFGKEAVQKAAREIYQLIPIDLFTVSDRIGNILFQFPSINIQFSYTKDEKKKELIYYIQFDERLQADSEENNFQYELEAQIVYDDNITAYNKQAVPGTGTVRLDMGETRELCRSVLSEHNSNLILSSQESNFIEEIRLRMHMGQQHGERRTLYDAQGNAIRHIEIVSGETMPINSGGKQEWKELVKGRRYRQRMEELDRRLEFIHYGLGGIDEREKALRDIRILMNRGDGSKVYLWDPYLDAKDLLETWYDTETYGLELRCITAAAGAGQAIKEWMEEQARLLEAGSNQHGIHMDFRCQWGNYGYGFHDRFLMIVGDEDREDSQVWSLGASINGLGKKHHIVQKVQHPQPIVDAFEGLWDMLPAQQCRIWKHGG